MVTNVEGRRRALIAALKVNLGDQPAQNRDGAIPYNDSVGCFSVHHLDQLQPSTLNAVTIYWVHAKGEQAFNSFDGNWIADETIEGQVYRVVSSN
jgi:hypothetical protein